MVKCKITNAVGRESSISLTVLPESGNIRGKMNIPCPENIIKIMNNGRPINRFTSNIIAKKLIGKEYDFALFGQVSKKQRRKDLKRRGLYMDKDLKREITFEEKKTDDKVSRLKYSEMLEMLENIEGIKRIEDFDFNGKKVTFFIQDDVTNIEIVKSFEDLPWVDFIRAIKKLEVR